MPMVDFRAIVGWLIAPAIVFALVYPSILSTLSLGLISPYAKANPRKRMMAAILDAFVVASPLFAFAATARPEYLVASAVYALLRDSVAGQSPGKFIVGLVVIHVETGRPARWRESARRNMLFLLPGANLPAVVLETRTLLRSTQGQRLGDRFANTQVVEGAGAAELVKGLQDALIGFTARLGQAPSQVDSAPVRDRAA